MQTLCTFGLTQKGPPYALPGTTKKKTSPVGAGGVGVGEGAKGMGGGGEERGGGGSLLKILQACKAFIGDVCQLAGRLVI